MRILILGGTGMVGHRLAALLSQEHHVMVTVRNSLSAVMRFPWFTADNTIPDVEASTLTSIEHAFDRAQPEVVVNCLGIVKQRAEAVDPLACIEMNAVLPHRLARLCAFSGARLIHLSTDCVFSGQTGGYTETDTPDPKDLYGRSKLLGEVEGPPALTIRTSFIGLELGRQQGLVEWFLQARGPVPGYRRAIFSGVTAAAFARILDDVVLRQPRLTGIRHLAVAPITKHELLSELGRRLGRSDITLVPNDGVVCDRSLDGRRFDQETGWQPPSWDRMLDELVGEIRGRTATSLSARGG